MSLFPSRRLAALCIAGLLLTACISDGPNRTGGAYLAGNGILLSNPIRHVVLKDFPVDTVWTSDLEPSHLGDSTVLVGRSGNFSAQARLFYGISDETYLSILDTSSLKLGVGFYRFGLDTAGLRATVVGVDSMTILVESWTVPDTGLSKSQRADTAFRYSRSIMQRQDTSALFPGNLQSVKDTIRLAVATAYGRDSLQAKPLPNLRQRLLQLFKVTGNDTIFSKTLVFLQLTSMDSASALLRLGGNLPADFSTNLLFGNDSNSKAASASHHRILPSVVPGTNSIGTNYKLFYSGPQEFLLHGKNRGMHVILNRADFIDSLRAEFSRQGLPYPVSGPGAFDLSFFVPLARMVVPLDTVRIQGNTSIDFRLFTDIDSSVPAPPSGSIYRSATMKINDTMPLLTIGDLYTPGKITDSILVVYVPASQDSSLRTIVVKSAKDTTRHDTLNLAVGQSREFSRAPLGGGSVESLVYFFQAAADSLVITYFIDSKTIEEPKEFRDPKTGEEIADLNKKIERFVKAGQDTMSLRATRGIQRLINRKDADSAFAADFFVQPITGAVDLGLNRRVTYPVMAEILPQFTAGRLHVTLDLYLYPLKER